MKSQNIVTQYRRFERSSKLWRFERFIDTYDRRPLVLAVVSGFVLGSKTGLFLTLPGVSRARKVGFPSADR